MALTVLKAAFVREYQVDQNATQAAIRAGYSERTAYSQGSRLLKDVEVQQALQQVAATALQVVESRLGEAAGSAAWIVEKAVEVVEYATALVPARSAFGVIIRDEEGEIVFEMTDPKLVAPHLALLAKRHLEFSEKIDARVLHGVVKVERGTRSLT